MTVMLSTVNVAKIFPQADYDVMSVAHLRDKRTASGAIEKELEAGREGFAQEDLQGGAAVPKLWTA